MKIYSSLKDVVKLFGKYMSLRYVKINPLYNVIPLICVFYASLIYLFFSFLAPAVENAMHFIWDQKLPQKEVYGMTVYQWVFILYNRQWRRCAKKQVLMDTIQIIPWGLLLQHAFMLPGSTNNLSPKKQAIGPLPFAHTNVLRRNNSRASVIWYKNSLLSQHQSQKSKI